MFCLWRKIRHGHAGLLAWCHVRAVGSARRVQFEKAKERFTSIGFDLRQKATCLKPCCNMGQICQQSGWSLRFASQVAMWNYTSWRLMSVSIKSKLLPTRPYYCLFTISRVYEVGGYDFGQNYSLLEQTVDIFIKELSILTNISILTKMSILTKISIWQKHQFWQKYQFWPKCSFRQYCQNGKTFRLLHVSHLPENDFVKHIFCSKMKFI